MIDILDDLMGTDEPTGRGTGRPDVSATCAFCEAAVTAMCNACQRRVCREHSWTMLGLCTHCAREDRMDYFQRAPGPENGNWLEAP